MRSTHNDGFEMPNNSARSRVNSIMSVNRSNLARQNIKGTGSVYAMSQASESNFYGDNQSIGNIPTPKIMLNRDLMKPSTMDQ